MIKPVEGFSHNHGSRQEDKPFNNDDDDELDMMIKFLTNSFFLQKAAD